MISQEQIDIRLSIDDYQTTVPAFPRRIFQQ